MVGDIGACKELLPVATLLKKENYSIVWVADPQGKAQTLLTREHIPFITGEPIQQEPNLVLVGTSATARGAQISWSNFARQKNVPLVWYEDVYGTAAVSLGSGPEPDTLIVIDKSADQIASTRMKSAKVLVGGKPTYEDLRSPAHRIKLANAGRKKLGLQENECITSFISSGENSERVRAHIQALYPALKGNKVIIRLHPKLAGEAAALMEQACNLFGNQLLESSSSDTLEVIFASDLVITDYSGDAPYQAALGNIPVIMTLFPDCQEQMEKRGYINSVPPLLAAGACWGARTPYDLEILTKGINRAPLAALNAIEQNIKPFLPLTQQGGARRIANIVKSRLTT